MTISAAIWALILGIAGAAIYGVFFKVFEGDIRKYLAKRARGWLRRFYVNVFVQAVNGQSQVDTIVAAAQLKLVFPFMMLVILAFLVVMQGEAIARIQADVPRAFSQQDLEGFNSTLVFLKAALIGVGTFFLYGLCRTSFVMWRAEFERELHRFMNRIQVLASKSELAALMEAEAKVKDEETAQAFVRVVRATAKRHGVEQLVETFLLWETRSNQTETNH